MSIQFKKIFLLCFNYFCNKSFLIRLSSRRCRLKALILSRQSESIASVSFTRSTTFLCVSACHGFRDSRSHFRQK